jgi:hypothetical protein
VLNVDKGPVDPLLTGILDTGPYYLLKTIKDSKKFLEKNSIFYKKYIDLIPLYQPIFPWPKTVKANSGSGSGRIVP